MELRSTIWVAVTAAVAALATLVVALLPGGRIAEAPELHLLLETSAGLIALVAAVFSIGRYRQRRMRSDLALAVALSLLGFSHFVYSAIATALGQGDPGAQAAMAGVLTQLAAGALYLASAVVPDRPVSRRLERRAITIALGALLAVALAAAVFTPSGPAQPAGGVVQPIGVLVFAFCAVRFSQRAEAEHDPFLHWLAISSVLAAGARLNFTLEPTIYSSAVGPGDAFRLLAHAALVLAGLRELQGYWSGLAAAAATVERRRLAHDLHDGLAQELSLIQRHATTPAVREAADRALGDARRALEALRDDADVPFATRLAQAVRATGSRLNVTVDVTVTAVPQLAPEDRDALVRIACEAVANAARHGRARRVEVVLTGADQLVLTISDDGCGSPEELWPPRAQTGRFGLSGMDERATALGGRMSLRGRLGGGTTVEVTLP